MNIKKEGGRRLKAARNDKGWSQKDLERQTGGVLSASRIGNYEAGIRQMKSKEALVLAKALGVEPSYLLCVDGEEGGEMTPQETLLLRNFRALPEKDRNAYARRIETLALMYREPVPDERLGVEWTAPTAKKSKQTP